MKRLRFADNLISLILSGEKTATWRLFDDKDLTIGDELSLTDNAGQEFRQAVIISVREKPLGEINEADFAGHEKFASESAMYDTYRSYYGNQVGPESTIKLVGFKLKE